MRRVDDLLDVLPRGAGLRAVRLWIHEQVGSGRGAEIAACARRRARHVRDRRQPLRLAKAFVAAEEERLVAGDRPAERAAELVALEGWNRLGRIVEVRARVERAVAAELEAGSREAVRSRARDGHDDSPGAAAVFGAVVVDEHLELAHGVDAEHAAGGAAGRAVALGVHVRAVHLEADLVRPGAGDRDLRAHAAIDRLRRGGRRGDAELEQRQLGEVAAVERQLANLVLIDERRHRRLPRRDQRGVSRHDDPLRDAADLHLDVQHRRLPDREGHILVLGRTEPGKLDGHRVLAWDEGVGAVSPLRVGREDAALPGLHFPDRDSRPRQGGLGIVNDTAGDRSGRALRNRDADRGPQDRDGDAERACQCRCSEYLHCSSSGR